MLIKSSALGWLSLAIALGVLPSLLTKALAEDPDLPSVKILECKTACGHWTKPRRIESTASYSRTEIQNDDEGMVTIRFTVTADGNVVDPVVEQLVGSQELANNALETVTHWRFQPATLNGTAVQRPNELICLYYFLQPNGNAVLEARSSIVNHFDEARSLIRQAKYNEAADLLRSILAYPKVNLYETAMTFYLLALDEVALRDFTEASEAIDNAVIVNGIYLDPGVRESAMRMAIELDANVGQLANALDEYASLQKTAHIGSTDRATTLIAAVRARLDDPNPIVVSGEIGAVGNSGIWDHQLLRRNFDFAHLNGRLDRFELRCDQQEISSPINDKAEWHVPADWSGCYLEVFGSPGSTFRLVESDN